MQRNLVIRTNTNLNQHAKLGHVVFFTSRLHYGRPYHATHQHPHPPANPPCQLTMWLSRLTSAPQNSRVRARVSPMMVDRRCPTCISLATLGELRRGAEQQVAGISWLSGGQVERSPQPALWAQRPFDLTQATALATA